MPYFKTQVGRILTTRPDICALANIMLQVTEDAFREKHVRIMNKAVKRWLKTLLQGLKYHSLHLESLGIVEFNNASFGNNSDLSSHRKHIVLLTDDVSKNVLSYSSYNSKKFVLYVLKAEDYSFADCFHQASTLRDELSKLPIWKKNAPGHDYRFRVLF